MNLDLTRLLYRRQFVIGPHSFTPNSHWSTSPLNDGLQLSVHNDLSSASATKKSVTATLLGVAIDPYDPQASEAEIIEQLIDEANSLEQFICSTSKLAGRWLIIYQDGSNTYMFTDPCGFRQLFYCWDDEHFWSASQPELLKRNCALEFTTDPNLTEFLTHPGHVTHESAWIGAQTIYSNCFHLLPNHYVTTQSTRQVRFYPNSPPKTLATAEIVDKASRILQGVILGLANRYHITLALTAGLDSRVLLAASKSVSNKTKYFLYRSKAHREDHPDVWVPRKLAAELGIEFSLITAPHHLPGWFNSVLCNNVTCARALPKTAFIYDKLTSNNTSVNINGNASEICRNFYDPQCEAALDKITTADLASRFLESDNAPPFVLGTIEDWKRDLLLANTEFGLNSLDYLYWEHRLGNWGAQYPAEQDISSEEISPFNCRDLIEILASCQRSVRAAPDFEIYRSLIRAMWPEASRLPINPPPKMDPVSRVKRGLRRYLD